MFTDTSTSTSAPLPISKTTTSGSFRSELARLLCRGVSTLTAAISSSSSQRIASISCTAVSLIAMSLV